MSLTPGTEAYAQRLTREFELLKPELDELRKMGLTALAKADGARAILADVVAYNAKVKAHRAAIQRTGQAKANQRAAAKTRAAACGSCFTIHAGEC